MKTCTPQNSTAPCTAWDVMTGTIQLVIVGPGPHAWLAVSKPEYRVGQKPGSPAERAVARRAVQILQTENREDKDADDRVIRSAWIRAARELGHDVEDFK